MAVAAGRRNKKKAAGAPNTGDPSPGPLVTCADPGRAKLKHFYTCVAETYTVPRRLEIAAAIAPAEQWCGYARLSPRAEPPANVSLPLGRSLLPNHLRCDEKSIKVFNLLIERAGVTHAAGAQPAAGAASAFALNNLALLRAGVHGTRSCTRVSHRCDTSHYDVYVPF